MASGLLKVPLADSNVQQSLGPAGLTKPSIEVLPTPTDLTFHL